MLAVSCATGEYELVGIFHAGYTEGSALNVVVGIDQVRDLMTTLKRKPRDRDAIAAAPGGAGRVAVETGLDIDGETFFSFGPLVALVRGRPDHRLLFVVLSKDFPRVVAPLLVVEDLAANDPLSFGTLGRVWLGGPRGLELYDRAALEPDAAVEVERALDALRADAAAAIAYRSAGEQASASRQSTERLAKMAETLIAHRRRARRLGAGGRAISPTVWARRRGVAVRRWPKSARPPRGPPRGRRRRRPRPRSREPARRSERPRAPSDHPAVTSRRFGPAIAGSPPPCTLARSTNRPAAAGLRGESAGGGV